MPRIVPHSNPLALSLYELERMVSFSATWQSLTGATTWTDARDRICFIEDDTDPGTFPRPACVVSLNSFDYYLASGGSANYLRARGDLFLYLAIDPPAGYELTAGSDALDQQANRKAQLQYAANVFGDFMQDLAQLSAVDQTVDSTVTDSSLGVPSITMLDMCRTPETLWASVGQFWYLVVKVHWGDS